MAVEKEIRGVPGWFALLLLITVLLGAAGVLVQGLGVLLRSAGVFAQPAPEGTGWRVLIAIGVIAADLL